MPSKVASERPFSWGKLAAWWAASLVAAWAVGWSQITWADVSGAVPVEVRVTHDSNQQ